MQCFLEKHSEVGSINPPFSKLLKSHGVTWNPRLKTWIKNLNVPTVKSEFACRILLSRLQWSRNRSQSVWKRTLLLLSKPQVSIPKMILISWYSKMHSFSMSSSFFVGFQDALPMTNHAYLISCHVDKAFFNWKYNSFYLCIFFLSSFSFNQYQKHWKQKKLCW